MQEVLSTAADVYSTGVNPWNSRVMTGVAPEIHPAAVLCPALQKDHKFKVDKINNDDVGAAVGIRGLNPPDQKCIDLWDSID